MTHNPYTCDECARLGWWHTDGEGPFDLTEGAVAATGAWLTAFVLVLTALVVVLALRRIVK